MKFRSMQSQKSKKGFTLVELITVVAIVSLLVVYITIKLGSSNEDAKVALASTFILGNVPTVISSYKARHMNSCTGLDDVTDDSDGTLLRQELLSRGLIGTTPWNEEWSARYYNDERLLQIIFPLAGLEDPVTSTQDLVDNIYDAPQIDGLAVSDTDEAPLEYDEGNEITFDEDGVIETIDVGSSVARTGSVQVWYDCI